MSESRFRLIRIKCITQCIFPCHASFSYNHAGSFAVVVKCIFYASSACFFFADKTLRCVSNDKICFHAGFQASKVCLFTYILSFIPAVDLCYPSIRFMNCDPIICLSCSPYSFIPTSYHLLYVYLLALRVVVHA